jgi:ribosome-interacting GTPase 1
MAANLTPQYLKAEEECRRARTAEERLAALQKMWVELPKHKASEKLQAELKTKISDAKDDLEREKQSAKKGGVSYKIPRQGAGQVVLIGPPNAGKSRILSRLTRATPEVAPYPFTTREPGAGMMEFEDVRVQLIDTPPITADVMEGYLPDFVRNADAAALVLDLGDDDGPFAVEAVVERLAAAKRILVGKVPDAVDDPRVWHQATLLVANKIDADGAADRLEIVREMFAGRFPIHVISAERGDGLDELRRALYDALGVMRVYTKMPGKPPDMTAPYTCPIGSSVVDFAAKVHRDFAEKLKSARVWGTGVFDGQAVGRDHVLHDRDVVELHT